MVELKIKCPACGNEFPLDAAFREHFEEEKQQAVAVAMDTARREGREAAAESMRDEMAQQSEDQKKTREELSSVRASHQAELESVRSEAEHAATERLQQQVAQQGKDLKQAQDELSAERKGKDEAVNSAREEAEAEVEKRYRLKSEEDKTEKERLLREVESLRRRLSQGPVELQGEALEVWLKECLRSAFPLDSIEDVPKGQRGADLTQQVTNRLGQRCGVIVWEAKNTRNWNTAWLAKARQDAARVGNALPVIVSFALPDGIRTAECIDGVWVSSMECALVVGHLLRQQLVETSGLQRAMEGHEGKMANVYAYVVSDSFRSHMERIIDTWVELTQQINTEEKAMNAQWKVRRKQLEKVLNLTTDMHAEIKAIIGSEFPQVEGLSLAVLPSGEEDKELV